jgi:hypothetical protein
LHQDGEQADQAPAILGAGAPGEVGLQGVCLLSWGGLDDEIQVMAQENIQMNSDEKKPKTKDTGAHLRIVKLTTPKDGMSRRQRRQRDRDRQNHVDRLKKI